jgi:hypothetical protein
VVPERRDGCGWCRLENAARAVAIAAAALSFAWTTPAVAGKLGDTADVVDGSGDGGGSGTGGFCLFFCGAGAEDEAEVSPGPIYERDFSLLRFPYEHGYEGYAVVEEREYGPEDGDLVGVTVQPPGASVEEGNAVAFQAGADYMYDWDNVHLVTATGRLETSVGFGMALRHTALIEPLGVVLAPPSRRLDMMHLTELWASIRPVTTSTLLLRMGGSGMLMVYDGRAWGGVLGGLELELFPVRPIVVTAGFGGGRLKRAGYVRARMTAGVIVGPAELYAGYGMQAFFGEGVESIIYHGLVGGLRFWF